MAEANTEEAAPEAAEESKPSLLPKIAVSGFISFVVVIETCLFFFMVPNAEDVAALAESRLIDQVEQNISGEDGEDLQNENDIVQIKIGRFNDSFVPPGAVKNYAVDFDLSISVYRKDEQVVTDLLAKKEDRLRSYISLEVRSANLDELRENQLGLIRRRILAKTTEVLEYGEPTGSVPQVIEVLLPGSFRVSEE